MRLPRALFQLLAFIMLCGLSAAAQTVPVPSDAKQFVKDGVSFNYGSGWAFNDTSSADAQQMTFGRTDAETQIIVFVYRERLTKPEQIAEARRVLVDKYVTSTNKQFQQEDPKAQSAPATSEIGGVASEGVKIRASLGGVPGTAEIQSAVVGQRLIVLTLMGADRDLRKATPVWDLIRSTMKIEEPQPKTLPSPSPSPKPTP